MMVSNALQSLRGARDDEPMRFKKKKKMKSKMKKRRPKKCDERDEVNSLLD